MAEFVIGLFVGFFAAIFAVVITYLLCAAGAEAKLNTDETVDEWGRPKNEVTE